MGEKRCSFCKKSRDSVLGMIEGYGLFICSQCVASLQKMIESDISHEQAAMLKNLEEEEVEVFFDEAWRKKKKGRVTVGDVVKRYQAEKTLILCLRGKETKPIANGAAVSVFTGPTTLDELSSARTALSKRGRK